MPRRSQVEKSDESMGRALDAALALFSSQGFGATTMRQIAERAGLSTGNIYHHFPNKEAIFERLLERYWQAVLDPKLELNRVFRAKTFPEDLEQMARAIEKVVDENSAYILLIYVDVIEFGGRHIRGFYETMPRRFREAYGDVLEERRARGDFGDVDPMVALMVATRWFFFFYTVEKCFGVPMHFGISPDEARDEFIRLVRYGLLPRTGSAPGKDGDEDAARPPREGKE